MQIHIYIQICMMYAGDHIGLYLLFHLEHRLWFSFTSVYMILLQHIPSKIYFVLSSILGLIYVNQ